MPVFSENEDSSSDYRKISIPSVHSLQTLKNRLLAIKSFWNFDSNSINKIHIEGAGEAVVENISDENVKMLRNIIRTEQKYLAKADPTEKN